MLCLVPSIYSIESLVVNLMVWLVICIDRQFLSLSVVRYTVVYNGVYILGVHTHVVLWPVYVS